jgi:hypothetical protein
MARERYRYSVIGADGTVLVSINPPPTVVKIIKDQKQDKIWKDWLFLIYTFVGELSYQTSGFIAPNMTTADRNALTAENGMIIYNTTTTQFEFYENGSWVTK